MRKRLLILICNSSKSLVSESDFIELLVSPDEAGSRLDRYLSEKPGVLSRSKASLLVSKGFVSINGKLAKASSQVHVNDVVRYRLPEAPSTSLQPLDLQLDVLFEDDEVLVINKPAGLVVHPAAGHAQDTLVNALIYHTQDLSSGFQQQRPGIVHRLDKDTSGVLVVAKSDFSQIALSEQFKQKITQRIYQAVVFGHPKNSEGTITSFLGRHPSDRKRFASVSRGGKKAVTHYKVLATSSAKETSLIELRLETGRTHQIRIHLSELGHPIVGDSVYSKSTRVKSISSPELRKEISGLTRFLLHACELGFWHPRTQKLMTFRSAWPQDMVPLLQHMGYGELI